jgi:hypothetical protein
MKETENYPKDLFNPMFAGRFQGPGMVQKRNFEPSRNNAENQKYNYVVDWQITDSIASAQKNEKSSNPPLFW